MRLYRVTFARLLVLALCFSSASAWALDPSKPPSGNFDLTHWKLQLPTSNGILTSASGSVDEIKPSQLTTGWFNTYFQTGADGSMVFWAPDNGAHTDSSPHHRSELREEIIPNNDSTNWFLYGTHSLSGQCQVLQVPSDTKKTIIGQIHGFTGAALPLVKLEYNNGTLEGMIKTNSTDDNSDKTFAFGKSGITSNIFYQIKVVNGLVSIIMNNTTNSVNVFQSDPAWAANTVYFKAGDYNQTGNACNCSNDGARVAFYQLSVTHAASITNHPASQIVLVGSNVTFRVGALGNALGNGPIGYQWLLNSATIANATNNVLVIPNVQLTNAGTYSAVVSDFFGFVTSSNAVLTVNPVAPVANFGASPTNGLAPLGVAFTDTSSGSPTSWSWTFGDSGTSTVQNPGHTYSAPGAYTVRLIASNAGGSSTNTQTNFITVSSVPPPVASFSTAISTGAAPLQVVFADASSGSITSWAWVFGDGNTSANQNSSNTYTNPGLYTVREIVSGPGGSSTDTVANLIAVYDPFAWWQLGFFGSTNNGPNTAPDADYTGTGMSNTNKFLASLNPTNPVAYLHILSIARTNGTDINVTYLGANGDNTWAPGIATRTNVLEFTGGNGNGDYSNNFVTAGVTDILSGGTGTGFVTNMIDPGGATNNPARYYRVRVLLP